jgi:hypothetical protein
MAEPTAFILGGRVRRILLPRTTAVRFARSTATCRADPRLLQARHRRRGDGARGALRPPSHEPSSFASPTLRGATANSTKRQFVLGHLRRGIQSAQRADDASDLMQAP